MQLGFKVARGVGADRVDRVGDAVTLDFLRIDLAVGTTGKGQMQQPQPRGGGRRLLLRLERRARCGDDEQPVERQFLQRRTGHQHVAVVHGVERAAK